MNKSAEKCGFVHIYQCLTQNFVQWPSPGIKPCLGNALLNILPNVNEGWLEEKSIVILIQFWTLFSNAKM